MSEVNTAFVSQKDDALGEGDAVDVAARIASGQVSGQEVVQAAITRAQALEPSLRAIECERYEQALNEADFSKQQGPLAGVPTFIKDNTDVLGLPTRHGSRATPDRPAMQEAEFLRQYLASGLLVLGKSRLPEVGLTATTEFSQSEPSRNPFNTAYSTGGSSGGSAALVAAGVVPIAHANDGGGSIRIPASCCGVVGLKPSRGRMLDQDMAKSLPINLVCEGVVTRSVRDTAVFHHAAEMYAPSKDLPPIGLVEGPNKRRLRIGYTMSRADGALCDEECVSATQNVAALCEGLGHYVEEVSAPLSQQLADDFLLYWASIAASVRYLGRWVFGKGFQAKELEPLTQGLSQHFLKQAWRFPFALKRLRNAVEIEQQLFQKFDVLLTPTLAQPPAPIGHLALDLPFNVARERLTDYAAFTPMQNVTGAPAISLPLARSAKGLPIGMQFAAPLGGERRLLELAFELEAAQPWSYSSQ